MTPRDDDSEEVGDDVREAQPGDRPDVVAEMLSDDVIAAVIGPDDAALTQALRDLRMLGEGAPLEPSPQLVRAWSRSPMLAGARRVLLGAAAACVLLFAGGWIAAANDALPNPAQRFVSDIVNNLSPFSISPTHGPMPAPTPKSTPTVPPTHSSTPTPTPTPTEHDGGSGSSPDPSEGSTGSEDPGGLGGGASDDSQAPPAGTGGGTSTAPRAGPDDGTDS